MNSYLFSNSGMQFRTESQRDSYFSRHEEFPTEVQFGSAMSHAANTNLGIFGSESPLRGDCARIMRCEIAHYAIREGIPLSELPDLDDVLGSVEFQQAFVAARYEPDSLLQLVTGQLGISGKIGRCEDGIDESYESEIPLHERVFNEMEKKATVNSYVTIYYKVCLLRAQL